MKAAYPRFTMLALALTATATLSACGKKDKNKSKDEPATEVQSATGTSTPTAAPAAAVTPLTVTSHLIAFKKVTPDSQDPKQLLVVFRTNKPSAYITSFKIGTRDPGTYFYYGQRLEVSTLTPAIAGSFKANFDAGVVEGMTAGNDNQPYLYAGGFTQIWSNEEANRAVKVVLTAPDGTTAEYAFTFPRF